MTPCQARDKITRLLHVKSCCVLHEDNYAKQRRSVFTSEGCLSSTLRSHSNIRSRSKPSSSPLILRGEHEHQDQRLI